MWSNLHSDLLANIFSYLPPDSLALARSACRHWHTCSRSASADQERRRHHPAWFVVFPTRHRGLTCYACNPITGNWHVLGVDFIPRTARPIAQIGGLVLLKPATTKVLQLALCNPFTGQYRSLPVLNVTRTNPAVGVVDISSPCFRIYVAGGMSDAPSGGASYEPTLEMYDSQHDTWQVVGSMPVEFAVRLTVWTPNESVYSNGVLYWMTSARAYSIMGFEIATGLWRELGVPMADRLEFAALMPRNGKLALVGGTVRGDGCIWELGGDDDWGLVEKVPVELRKKFWGGKGSWGGTKCVGMDGAVCLYRDIGSGMVMWREVVPDKDKWEWEWVEGCDSIRGKQVQNVPIKGLILHPNLAPDIMLNS